MVRMARSQTNIAAPNQGLAKVATQNFNQTTPQFQSESAGLDPFRGDMTNAFNNFFGSIQNSLGTIQDVQRTEDKRLATEYANDMKARAATEAQDYYVLNPTSRDVNAALETEDSNLQSNRHFVDTYKQTLGSNIGSRLYSDFTASQANANPANFEANAQAFWQENYTEGTGDPLVDLAMQTAWTRNYENNRISAAQETVRRQRAAAALEHRRSIYRALDGDVSIEMLNGLIGGGPLTGGETRGQRSARDFGIVMEAVANGDLSSEQINVVDAWINNVPTGPNGERGQSIAQQFPILADRAEMQLPAIRARGATITGQQAVTDITNQLSAGLAEFDDPVDQMNYLNQNAPVMIEQLRNTRGVSGAAVDDFRNTVDTQRTDMLNYVEGRNNWTSIGAGGQPTFGFDPTDTTNKAALVDAFASADNPIDAANILANAVGAFGPEVIPDAIKQNLNAQLGSPDPQVRMKAATAVLQASGVSGSYDVNIQNALLDEDAQTRMNVIRSYMDQGEGVNAAVALAGNVDAAMAIIEDEGIEVSYSVLEGTKAEQDAEMREFFTSKSMLSYLEATVEGKGFFARQLTWQNGSGITAEAQAAMRRAGDSYIIQRRALGQTTPTQGEIRQHVAETMVDRMFIENGIWNYDETVQPSADRGVIRVGTSVYNHETGTPENTIATMTTDLSTLEDSFFKVNFDGDFSTIADPDATNTNGRMVLHDGLPVNLAIGSNIRIDQEYYGEGASRGQRRGAINDAFNGAETVTLTGNPETDAALLFPALGPGVTLVPDRSLDGDVIGYSLRVSPRFEGEPSADVEAMANTVRNMPIDPGSIDPVTGFARPKTSNPMDIIPDEFWTTQEGIDLKQAIDANDPNAGYYVDGVARRFQN